MLKAENIFNLFRLDATIKHINTYTLKHLSTNNLQTYKLTNLQTHKLKYTLSSLLSENSLPTR